MRRMVKKAAVLALVLCLLLVLLDPGLAQAQGRLEVLESRTQMEFPSRLTFSLSVRSDVDISDIRLCYQIERVSFAEVTSEVYIEFVPANEVEVNWALEMVKIGGLPPGSGVKYWWLVKDTRGDKVETPPAQLRFDDLRYSWRNLTQGDVTVYWYEGGGTFGQELMATAQQALAQLARDTGAELEKPVRLYVYADPEDLRGAMIYPQEWTGGVAFTRYGTIAIGISPANIEWGRRAVAHELTHLVIHQMPLNPYSGLPAWLDEGLAMHTEGLLDPRFASRLAGAVAEDSLISVCSLASPFSAYTERSTLSYAQSYSLVDFLLSSYGQAKMLELLSTLSEGSTYDGALGKVYGFDTEGLDALWRGYVTRQYQTGEGLVVQPALAWF